MNQIRKVFFNLPLQFIMIKKFLFKTPGKDKLIDAGLLFALLIITFLYKVYKS